MEWSVSKATPFLGMYKREIAFGLPKNPFNPLCPSQLVEHRRDRECWPSQALLSVKGVSGACLAVSLDPALDSLKSKDFPFVRKRNTFWRAQYAAEVSRHDRRVSRLCWSSHILSQGEAYTHFSWGTDSSSGCNPLSVPLSIWNIWFLLAVVWVE